MSAAARSSGEQAELTQVDRATDGACVLLSTAPFHATRTRSLLVAHDTRHGICFSFDFAKLCE
jgi:hypothetical protein